MGPGSMPRIGVWAKISGITMKAMPMLLALCFNFYEFFFLALAILIQLKALI